MPKTPLSTQGHTRPYGSVRASTDFPVPKLRLPRLVVSRRCAGSFTYPLDTGGLQCRERPPSALYFAPTGKGLDCRYCALWDAIYSKVGYTRARKKIGFLLTSLYVFPYISVVRRQ